MDRAASGDQARLATRASPWSSPTAAWSSLRRGDPGRPGRDSRRRGSRSGRGSRAGPEPPTRYGPISAGCTRRRRRWPLAGASHSGGSKRPSQSFAARGPDRLARRCGGGLGGGERLGRTGDLGEAGRGDRTGGGTCSVSSPRAWRNKEIAARLYLSPRTVEKHVESLLRKIGARSRTQLVAFAGRDTAGPGAPGKTT